MWEEAGRFSDRYSEVLTPNEAGGFLARAIELPTAFANGDTREEALAGLRRAIRTIVAALLESGQEPPAPSGIERRVEQVNIRLTPRERLQLESAARKHGFRGLADYVRAAALARAG